MFIILDHNCSSKNVSLSNPEVKSRIHSIIGRKKEVREMIFTITKYSKCMHEWHESTEIHKAGTVVFTSKSVPLC